MLIIAKASAISGQIRIRPQASGGLWLSFLRTPQVAKNVGAHPRLYFLQIETTIPTIHSCIFGCHLYFTSLEMPGEVDIHLVDQWGGFQLLIISTN